MTFIRIIIYIIILYLLIFITCYTFDKTGTEIRIVKPQQVVSIWSLGFNTQPTLTNN
jgi:hypothetical protein